MSPAEDQELYCATLVEGEMPEDARLSADQQQTWRAYLDSSRLLMHRIDQQLQAESGITFTDFELLLALSESEGKRKRMSDLAEAIHTTRSGVTRAVKRLVDAGLVERVVCDSDRRGKHAQITAAGESKLGQSIPGHFAVVRGVVFEALAPTQVVALRELGESMRDSLQAS